MVMRLVRDEPDVRLDESRADGVERDATVFTDLAFVREPPLKALPPLTTALPPRKARKPMSRKSPSQVIEVSDFPPIGDENPSTPPTPASVHPTPEEAPVETAAVDEAAVDEAPVEPQSADAAFPETQEVESAVTPVAEVADNDIVDEMSDGAVPPREAPMQDADEDGDDTGAADAFVPLAALEALLLTTHHPLTPGRLNELLEVGSARAIRNAIRTLNDQYEQSGRSFRIEQVAGGYQILTVPEHGEVLRRLHQKDADAKLTKAALETLSIVAYKQPILRADIEAIRGVACGETLRSLMEKHLVKIAGRAEEPGRPILYGTTKRFLELFGLNNLKDLPRPEDFKQPKQ